MSPTPDVWNRRLFGCAMATAAALGPKTLLTPQCVRADDSIRVIGDDGRPVAPPQPPSRAVAAKPLSQAEVERRLGQIPVIVLVNEDDSPYFTSKDGGLQVAYFYLDPTDALRELRVLRTSQPDARLKLASLAEVYFPLVLGDPKALGGSLRLRPSRRQIVNANRALQYNSPEGSLLPVSLSEDKGQVPLFYSERVALTSADGSQTKYPFYLRKEELDRDFASLAATGQLQGAGGGAGGEAFNPRSNSARRGGKSAGDASAAAGGIPSGLTRVATLDGLVRQMRSGEVDLTDAVIIGSPDAMRISQQLVAEVGADGK